MQSPMILLLITLAIANYVRANSERQEDSSLFPFGNLPMAASYLQILKAALPVKNTNVDISMPGSRSIALFPSNKKKGDGISGFLGMEDIANPIIQLRRFFQGSVNPEPDCIRTYFMGPYSQAVTFSATSAVGSRADRICKWNFIGTEPCIPLLSCSIFNLQVGGKAEYLEVYDGHLGFQKFYGTEGPMNISAYGGLRDLYLKYQGAAPDSKETIKFNCTVSCSNRGDGQCLPIGFEPDVTEFCQCGKRPNQDRIVGGENSTKHEFPWMAGLVKAQTRQPFCGASIINDRIILTAAHCFKGDFLQIANMEVLLGGHILDVTPNQAAIVKKSRSGPQTYDPITLSKLDAGNGSVRYRIEEAVIHPLYVKETNDFDIAVIRLSDPIDFISLPQLRPVCIPKLGSYLRTFAKRNAIVAGWGLGGAENNGTISLLQKLNVTIYSPKDCKDAYAHRVNRRMMCAGYINGGKDSCMGDSGGPLILEDKPQIWYQVGSVSWGEGCALSNSPGAYIRTTEIGQWLHYHSNTNFAKWCEVPSPKTKSN